ncbi:MAG: tryptophan 7-halogenase [Gammaproteobacteria bacterium]|nr:tryptophan 7-halogenase [Gammaproteobacteria bacterium]
MKYDVDVAVIGAGPAGALAAGLLAGRGLEVLVVEAARFPRFSIGESLLPQSHGLSRGGGHARPRRGGGLPVQGRRLLRLRGAARVFRVRRQDRPRPRPCPGGQARRVRPDPRTPAEACGARIHFGTRVTGWHRDPERVVLSCEDETGELTVESRFLVDASGFGRVLVRMADLEYPSGLPPRRAIFRHLRHRPLDGEFDRNKITIARADIELPYWFWLIPFADGTASFGPVGDAAIGGDGELDATLAAHVATMPLLADWLDDAESLMPARTIVGYSCNVRQLHGDRFVLLGNAGEFVDPIFSSGVSIACRSALMAAPLVERALRGRDGRLAGRVRTTASARRQRVPRVRRGVVRGYAAAADLLDQQERTLPPLHQFHSRRIRLGRRQPLHPRLRGAAAHAGEPGRGLTAGFASGSRSPTRGRRRCLPGRPWQPRCRRGRRTRWSSTRSRRW